MIIEAPPTMELTQILIWLRRATGFGYKSYPPLAETEVSADKNRELTENTDKLAQDVRRLERELRKIGIRVPPSGNYGD